ncbi:IspD/TarI family cytidylyltransferase [Leptospira sp. GIMC2001]|uniref:IspD/TarI family cytidylyltransferase n=1 Tax=Leptospira sp. GIMC2001 TaxID=1513297 RepID=UPI0023491A67|nr:IspD/TarI family cytidylyltransferase [Leptospira sp. GIMC2001]WCL50885.1 IspD/TarI family cytidylyltransferase [Leptospira sp. GIMC2001]
MGNIYAILLAGGEGKRLGADKPKQFLKLGTESLLQRSVRRFRSWGFLKSIVVVGNKDYLIETETEIGDLLEYGDSITEGGVTRHESCIAGIEHSQASAGDYIFIHDVARPFFLHSELDELLKVAQEYGSATLAMPASDTLIFGNKYAEKTIDREGVWQIKTPQILSYDLYIELVQESLSPPHPTDLCTWCLLNDKKTGIVKCTVENIKITYPTDLEVADSMLSRLQSLGSDFQ